MALTARPSKKIDLSKIDEIQSEFFEEESVDNEITGKESTVHNNAAKKTHESKTAINKQAAKSLAVTKNVSLESKQKTLSQELEKVEKKTTQNVAEQGSQKLADLLATARTGGARHTSRPYTVPRSLTIDLNRMKSKFKMRDLHYTQNELMDKMVKESLETVTADNYFSLREKAFTYVKSPEQSSRRTVTLTEEAAIAMADLKADIALQQNRRITSDEIFTTLLAIAFSNLYERGLL